MVVFKFSEVDHICIELTGTINFCTVVFLVLFRPYLTEGVISFATFFALALVYLQSTD